MCSNEIEILKKDLQRIYFQFLRDYGYSNIFNNFIEDIVYMREVKRFIFQVLFVISDLFFFKFIRGCKIYVDLLKKGLIVWRINLNQVI